MAVEFFRGGLRQGVRCALYICDERRQSIPFPMSTMLKTQMVVPAGQGRAAASFTTCCDPVDGSIASRTRI